MKKLTALFITLSMAFSLAACSSNPASPTAPQTSSVPASNSSGITELEVTKGGTLILTLLADAATMVSTDIRSPTNLYYASPIYETLLAYDKDGNPQPFLAKSFTEDIANNSYIIELNKGIKFHDGTELNAEVCKWNLDLYLEKGVLRTSFFSNVDSVEVTGDYTVVLKLKQWDSTLPNALARQGGYMISKTAYEKSPEGFGEAPIGTGPFKLAKWERGVSMEFAKFSDYWQGEPYLDGVKIVIYANDLVAQAAVQAGDVHIMSPTDASIIEDMKSKGFNVYTMNVPQSCYTVCFNTVKGDELANVKVRQAMAYAINDNDISVALFGDYASPTNQYAAKGSTYYNDKIEIKYDVEKAKALMKEAGLEKGFSTTLTTVNSTRMVEVCQAVADQLSKINIKVDLNLVDGGAYIKSIDKWESGKIGRAHV